MNVSKLRLLGDGASDILNLSHCRGSIILATDRDLRHAAHKFHPRHETTDEFSVLIRQTKGYLSAQINLSRIEDLRFREVSHGLGKLPSLLQRRKLRHGTHELRILHRLERVLVLQLDSQQSQEIVLIQGLLVGLHRDALKGLLDLRREIRNTIGCGCGGGCSHMF